MYQQQYGQYPQYAAPPAPHYGDQPYQPPQQYSSPPPQQYYAPPPQQYSAPTPQQYQQGYQNGSNQGGYYQPHQQNYQQQQQPQQRPQDDYDPSRPAPPKPIESKLFCHLPRAFGVWNKYVFPYEETLIVHNPCDFRRDEITIKNSRFEPIFKTSGLHKAHAKDYPQREGKPECIIRDATSGQDLMIIRHDPDKKRDTYFSVEDARDGSIIAWAAGDDSNGVHKSTYNIFVFNRLSKPSDFREGDENIAKVRADGDIQDDKLDFKFENTENRFAMLRLEYDQAVGGPEVPDHCTGTKVAAGFDVAVVCALMIIIDMHNCEYDEEAEHDAKVQKYGSKVARAAGKAIVKGIFSAAGGGGN